MHSPALLVLFVLLLLAISLPAAADPPDFSTPVCSQPAVTGLKITNDRWPDASSPLQFGLDAIRLENARTDQEKAIAVWLWTRRFTMYTNGTPPQERGPDGKPRTIVDPVKILNIWGAHWCDGLSRCMELSWRNLGYPAQKFYKSGHTLCDAGWVDDDGVMRYHLFDVSEGWFAFTRDGKRIASADEIARDWSLAYRPAFGPSLRTHSLSSLWGWVHATHLPIESSHKMELQMRPGEEFCWAWGNIKKPYQDNVGRRGDAVPEEHGPFTPDFGNGLWSCQADLTQPGTASQCHQPPANCKFGLDNPDWTIGKPCVGSADGTGPAVLVYRFCCPYIHSELNVHPIGGKVKIELSDDGGKNWRVCDAPTFPNSPMMATGLPAKQGREISAFGRYDLLVRVSVLSGRLVMLKFYGTTQINLYSIAQLMPGDNRITVDGKLDKGFAVRVQHNWKDARGDRHEDITEAEEFPHSFSIRIAGRRWGDVACATRTVSIIPRKGMRSGEKASDLPLEKIDPMPSYLLSLGKTPVPPLKKLDEYLATLRRSTGVPPVNRSTGFQPVNSEHGQDAHATSMPDRNELADALAGIRVIAFNASSSPSPRGEGRGEVKAAEQHPESTIPGLAGAYDAVREIAMSNLDRPKLQALQVMYWLDRKRATADFLKIVREEEPALKLLADAKLDPKKVDVIEDDRDPASVRRGHFYNVVAQVSLFLADEKCIEAVPALAKLCDEQAKTRDEPRRALLRSLGLLGDKRAVPVLLKYAAAEPDDAEIAVESLGQIGDRGSAADAWPIVRKAARDGYTPLRRNALLALGRLGDRESLPMLREALADNDEDARGAAAEAIGLLGDAGSLAALTAAAKAEKIAWTKKAIERAIAKIAK